MQVYRLRGGLHVDSVPCKPSAPELLARPKGIINFRIDLSVQILRYKILYNAEKTSIITVVYQDVNVLTKILDF